MVGRRRWPPRVTPPPQDEEAPPAGPYVALRDLAAFALGRAPACGALRVGARGAASAGARMALVAAGGLPRPGRRPYAAVMHGHGGGGRTVLSQSEDQSRPHPAQHFVHPMSTQVRSPGPDVAEGGPRSDPQIATRTQNRASRQTADYTGRRNSRRKKLGSPAVRGAPCPCPSRRRASAKIGRASCRERV